MEQRSASTPLSHVGAHVTMHHALHGFQLQVPAVKREMEIGPSRHDPAISFEPLIQCGLTRFGFRGISGAIEPAVPTLSDAQIEQIRQMGKLKSVEFAQLDAALLRRLLAKPHSLQWLSIVGACWTAETLDALAGLPSLTSFRPLVLSTNSFDFLEELTQLRILHLTFDRIQSRHNIVVGVAVCHRLVQLSLSSCKLTSDDLTTILHGMSSLTDLELSHMLELDSLGFLNSAALTKTLTSLAIHAQLRMPVLQLRQLHGLHHLKRLAMASLFDPPLDEYCLSLFRDRVGSSRRWSRLSTFNGHCLTSGTSRLDLCGVRCCRTARFNSPTRR